jgi:hypothetical protein
MLLSIFFLTHKKRIRILYLILKKPPPTHCIADQNQGHVLVVYFLFLPTEVTCSTWPPTWSTKWVGGEKLIEISVYSTIASKRTIPVNF